MKILVTLSEEAIADPETTQRIYDAISMLKGVSSVITIPQDKEYDAALEQAKSEIQQKMLDALK